MGITDAMFFTFPEDARWNAERQAVELWVEIGEYRGVVRVSRRVFQQRLPEWQQDAYRMIHRRAKTAGIKIQIGNHTFRATGITACLKNGGLLETAQQMAAHESPRTTGLYDRRSDDVSLDEVERIGI
jgi:integrase